MEELFNHHMGVTIIPCVAETEVSLFSSCFFTICLYAFYLCSGQGFFYMRVKLLQETCGLLHVLLFFSFDSFFITIDSKICGE